MSYAYILIDRLNEPNVGGEGGSKRKSIIESKLIYSREICKIDKKIIFIKKKTVVQQDNCCEEFQFWKIKVVCKDAKSLAKEDEWDRNV